MNSLNFVDTKENTALSEQLVMNYLSKVNDPFKILKENPLYIEHNGIPLCEILKQNLNLK